MTRRKTWTGLAALLAVLVLWTAHILPASAQACAPNICCATNPTTGTPACGAAVGNPLNVMSGNKFQREVDMPALPGVLGLELVRYYNSEASIADHRGILGRGWRLSYDAELVVRPGGNIITVHQGDGTQTLYAKTPFQPEADTTIYGSNLPGGGTLRLKRAASSNPLGKEYILSPAGEGSGNRQTFDAQGKLVQITAPTGEFVSMQRDAAGLLLRVTDPQGRFLSFGYLPRRQALAGDKYRGVQHIDSPVGRFSYEYGSALPAGSTVEPGELIANLVKVSRPTHYDPNTPANPAGGSADRGVSSSSISKSYHYEDARHPNLLTGISVQGQGSDAKLMSQRLVTWGYDAKGRANRSVKGSYDPAKPGPEQVTLEFNVKSSDGSGTTVLANSLGRTTRYSYVQIKGHPQLLEVRGAGCATCGPVNVLYRYDERGRQTQQLELDDKGQALRGTSTDYDGVDRPIQVNAFTVPNGKAGPLRMQVRYQYGPNPQNRLPMLIARPSVVAGKEHQVRIAYNDKGQPLSVTESGFSPLDDKGLPSGGTGSPIRRSTSYTYESINNRSVLVRIDGPLQNGPKNSPEDSDVTLLHYDKRADYLTSIVQPGDHESTVSYDRAGRIVSVRNAQGFETRFTFDVTQLVQNSSIGPAGAAFDIRRFKYDAQGRVTETGRGSPDDNSYQAQTRQAFDAAGRLQWSANALGILQQNNWDTESRLIHVGRYSSTMAQSLAYEYDEQGRLTSLRDRSGAAYRFSYDGQGRARILDSFGEVMSRAAAKAAGLVKPRNLRDDFGRVVLTLSPDSGRTLREYDIADRMVASQDALGNQARYAYDPQGRILHQTITEAATRQATQTHWHYQGRRLVWLEHPQQSERYAYDDRGWRSSKTVTLYTPAGERSSATHYEYDAQGTLQAASLPDGSRVRYERNGQGQVVALYRERIQTPWLRWALPGQVIVQNLQRDIVGIKRYATGNGITAQLQRSGEGGALARMAYSDTRAGAQAIVDRRYLWDTRGNLLVRQDVNAQGVQQQAYAYDLRNRLLASASAQGFSRFAYDALDRRVLAQQGGNDQASMQGTVKIGYDKEAVHRWSTASSAKDRVQARYDATGQPIAIGQRTYTWDALGRLARIKEGDKEIAAYRYNHRGERIAKVAGQRSAAYLYEDKQLSAELDGHGRITRQYIHLADTPIAAIETPQGVALASDDAWSALLADLRTIASGLFTADTTLVWLHPNHLGAPEAVTDAQGKLIWQASYEPFGQVRIKSGAFALNLRLPGQYEDAESGLYYNRQRYYDPERGQYLTPDPLGSPDGPNRYAYVAHNPLKYVDPEGLVLFAFDGTDNTDDVAWLADHNSSFSNVVRFRDAYADPQKRYVTGVGTDHANRDSYGDIISAKFDTGPVPDRGGNFSGPKRIERMLRYFRDEADAITNDSDVMQVDIIGFSRGAAEARDFANRLVANTKNGWYTYKVETGKVDPSTLLPIFETRCQMVSFRFMGLWDTVLSTNLSLTPYNLAIPSQFAYVAQAVALNEYRSSPAGVNATLMAFTSNFPYWDNTRTHLPADNHYGGFPLESIGTSSNTPGRVRIERGLIGAHADIGGGYGVNANGLATVALSWMVEQARLAGVSMNTGDIKIDMNNPAIHDQSNALRVGNPLVTSNFQAPKTLLGIDLGIQTYAVEDRQVNGGLGTGTQRGQTFGPVDSGNRSLTNSETHQFINYTPHNTAGDTRRTTDIPEISSLHNRTGTVDMESYMNWLRQHGYTFAGS